MGDEAAKVPADDAVPCGALAAVELDENEREAIRRVNVID